MEQNPTPSRIPGSDHLPVTHAFTVDVEEWFHGIPIRSEALAGAQSRLERGLHPLLELLDAASVKATFFVLGLVAQSHPDIVRRIVDGGHEIACHGWSHDLIGSMTRQRFREETVLARDTIQDLVGRRVVGYRAAYFSITCKTFWALEELAALGFEYDSSIFPVRNWRYGIPSFPSTACEIKTCNGTIREFPIGVRRIFGSNVPISGGAYFRLYPYALTRGNFADATKRGHRAVFYVHPWELDPAHPRVNFHWRASATHYAGLQTTGWKLKQLLRDFAFEPLTPASPQTQRRECVQVAHLAGAV